MDNNNIVILSASTRTTTVASRSAPTLCRSAYLLICLPCHDTHHLGNVRSQDRGAVSRALDYCIIPESSCKMTTTRRRSFLLLSACFGWTTLVDFAAAFTTGTSTIAITSAAPRNIIGRPAATTITAQTTTFTGTSITTRLHETKSSLFDRFANPKIDDPWLPLTEAGIAQVVAPTFQLFWLAALQSPFPSWAAPLYDPTFAPPRGAFLAPTLVHGAGLACCWLAGCLAAEAYAKDAYEGTIKEVVVSTLKAGAFSSGLLILATQYDLYRDMGGYYQLGFSPETDIQILRHTVELINDIVFEAVVLLIWRIIRRKRFDEDYLGRKLK
mgnify:CR=1 FL=1